MQLRPIALGLALFLAVTVTFGTEGTSLVYNGRLLSDGVPLDGSYDIKLALFGVESGGQPLGQPITNTATTVRSGVFSVEMEGWAAFFDGAPRWVEVAVRTNNGGGPFETLAPRQPVNTVPQSAFASRAGSASVANTLVGGGSQLTSIPAANLFGTVPLAALSGITSNQIDQATDSIYRDKSQRGIVTPFDFGAKGDGFTDDTAALQAMINRACTQRLVAFLPPAPGGFYRITDALYAPHALTLIGAAGAKHVTSSPTSLSVIKQFTRGKHGLVLQTANDSVHLASIVITAPEDNRSTESYGIWFAGGAPDADCSIVEQCMVSNFSIGIEAASQADSTFRQCSLGYNGTGIRISGVANNISLDSCQLSYNELRQVDIVSGKVIIQNSDIAAGADATRSAQGVFCSASDLTILSSRFEDSTTNSCLIASGLSRVTLINTMFKSYNNAIRYSVTLTNSLMVTINSIMECLGDMGVPILDHNMGKSGVYAIPPVKEVITTGNASYINTASVFTSGRSLWTGGGPGPRGIGKHGWAQPGTLEVEDAGAEHFLWAFGNLPQAGFQAVDLLAFAKQQRSGMVGNGSGLTNLAGTNITSGTITRAQIEPATDALYRNAAGVTNNQTAPVTLKGDLAVEGELRVPGTLVIKKSSGPNNTGPSAWFEVKSSNGETWKVPLYK